ncbi:YmzC family protein [Bacillus cereus]|nr:YmzC family protein [Bacillus cereus]MDG1566671.1 YmzC family protein [Bacillus cereus]
MTQIAENTFAIQEYNPLLSSENTIKIFKYNPDTNQLTLVKEVNSSDSNSYTYQLNETE